MKIREINKKYLIMYLLCGCLLFIVMFINTNQANQYDNNAIKRRGDFCIIGPDGEEWCDPHNPPPTEIYPKIVSQSREFVPSNSTLVNSELDRQPKNSAIFGIAGVDIDDKIYTNKTVPTGNNASKQIMNTIIIAYQYPQRVNATIEKLDDAFIYVGAGNSYQYSKTITEGKIFECGNSVEASLKVSSSISIGSEVGVSNFFGIDANVSTEITSAIEVAGSASFSSKTTKSITVGETHTYTLNSAIGEHFSFELRGTFNLYVIQMYQVSYYVVKKEIAKNVFTYEYSNPNYHLVYEALNLTLINNTFSRGFYRYALNSQGEFVYADNRVQGILYL